MNKYGELKFQLEGMKTAIAKLEYAMEVDKIGLLAIELDYLEEKFRRTLRETRILTNKN